MIEQFKKFLFHPNRFKISKAISLTKYCLEQKGIENILADITFRRFADKYKSLPYDELVFKRESEKAMTDKVLLYTFNVLVLIE